MALPTVPLSRGLPSLQDAEPASLGSSNPWKGQILDYMTSFPRTVLLANDPRAGQTSDKGNCHLGQKCGENFMFNLSICQESYGTTKPEGERGPTSPNRGTRRGPGIPAQAGLLSLPASPGKDIPRHEAPGGTLHGTFRISEALKKKKYKGLKLFF